MSLSNAPSAQPTEKVTNTSITTSTPSEHTSSRAALPSSSKPTSPPSSSSSSPINSSSSSSSSSSRPLPSTAVTIAAAEYRNAHKWDACVENALVKTGYGLLAAGALSLLLFRSAGARSAVIGLGGGFGAGMSWVECKQTFAVQSAGPRPQLSTLRLPTIPQPNTAHTSHNTGAVAINTNKAT